MSNASVRIVSAFAILTLGVACGGGDKDDSDGAVTDAAADAATDAMSTADASTATDASITDAGAADMARDTTAASDSTTTDGSATDSAAADTARDGSVDVISATDTSAVDGPMVCTVSAKAGMEKDTTVFSAKFDGTLINDASKFSLPFGLTGGFQAHNNTYPKLTIDLKEGCKAGTFSSTSVMSNNLSITVFTAAGAANGWRCLAGDTTGGQTCSVVITSFGINPGDTIKGTFTATLVNNAGTMTKSLTEGQFEFKAP